MFTLLVGLEKELGGSNNKANGGFLTQKHPKIFRD
jgi:hypothetical protein